MRQDDFLDAPAGQARESSAVSRVLLIGLLFVLIINASDTFITNVVGSSLLSLEHFPIIVMMLFLPLILLANPAVRWLGLRGLSPQ